MKRKRRADLMDLVLLEINMEINAFTTNHDGMHLKKTEEMSDIDAIFTEKFNEFRELADKYKACIIISAYAPGLKLHSAIINHKCEEANKEDSLININFWKAISNLNALFYTFFGHNMKIALRKTENDEFKLI